MDGPSRDGAIETRRLSKKFGALEALRGLDLAVPRGESVALFGPNGAGKTTLIRVLTLALEPSGGRLSIGGLDPRTDADRIRRSIGVISHQSHLYAELSSRENLEFFGALYGVRQPGRRAEELLELVKLSRRADDPLGTLSHGMRQRISLARALVHDPPIVFMDEPFTGLDPHAARILRQTLERLRREGRTVLFVTHNLTEGLELSDRWLLLFAGRIVEQGASSSTDRSGFEALYFDRVAAARSA